MLIGNISANVDGCTPHIDPSGAATRSIGSTVWWERQHMASKSRALSAEEEQVMFDLGPGSWLTGAIQTCQRQRPRLTRWPGPVRWSSAATSTMYLEVFGEVVIHAERDWLAVHSGYPRA